MREIIVKARTLAAMLHISERRVSQLKDDGVVLKGKRRGEYLFHESTQRYIAFLKAGGTERESKVQLEAAKIKLTEEQARKTERENDIADRHVAPVEMLEQALTNAAMQIIPILDSLPVEMKRDNPSLTGADIQIVKTSVAKCRNLISDIKLTDD